MFLTKRKTQWVFVAALCAAAMTAAFVAAQPAASGEEVIKITAKKFEYTPAKLTLKKGVPVVLELSTEDILMGFNAPALGVRADIVPGKAVRVRVVPSKAGPVEFYCDIFCGSGHEEMDGLITVVE